MYGSVPSLEESFDLASEDNTIKVVEEHSTFFPSLRVPSVSSALLFIFAIFAVLSIFDSGSSLDMLTTENSGLSFGMTYDYMERDGAIGADYPWASKYNGIVEPYRVIKLYATGLPSDTSIYTYNWMIDDSEMLSGESIEVTFETIGVHNIKLIELDNQGNLVRSTTGRLMSKYVRREIRQLFESDREAFFDAAEIVYQTSEEEGFQKYGKNFHSINFFARIHNTMAGAKDCDHFHGGLGFLPQHVAFTYAFELALQSVNPAVTVPYWDYTIEAHYVTEQNSLDAWRASPVFNDDWFGSASPPHHVVDSGRWAFVPVMQNAYEYCDVTNAYGMLRSPWNQNNIPYVTRSNQTYGFYLKDLPDCEDHYQQLALTSFSVFGTAIQYNPHGTVHSMIGGVWNADMYVKLVEVNGFTFKNARDIALEAFAWQKNMWRADYLTCPSTCSVDTPMTDCKCTCQKLSEWLSSGQSHEILAAIGPLFKDSSAETYLYNKNGEDKSTEILRMLCNDYADFHPTIGDSLESASPLDISFWSTHPTVERLFIWRKINEFTDETWTDNTASSVDGVDVGYCWGHNSEDVTIWKNLFDDSDQFYTNSDLYTFSDPNNEDFPYVFDNFRWSHCADEGYPLNLLNDGLPSGMSSPPL